MQVALGEIRPYPRLDWVVTQGGVLVEEVHQVETEPVDAALQPEASDTEHLAPHRRVAPVEVRLEGEEGVIVVLPGALVVLPGASFYDRSPVVGRLARGPSVTPYVPVTPRMVSRRT